LGRCFSKYDYWPHNPIIDINGCWNLSFESGDCNSNISQRGRKTGLAKVLHTHTALFQDGIGCFPGPAFTIEPLETPLQPFYCKPYRIPRALIDRVKAKIDMMVKLEIMKPNFNSPWGSPTLAVLKRDDDIWIVADFRMVNLRLCRKPYPVPNISELFQRIDGYDFASTLDLRLAFHHILLSEYASNVFTTVLPWGKYSYTRMLLGYTGAPDVFQHRMDQILGELPFCVCFIDDIAI
jgi:hypothetical protein